MSLGEIRNGLCVGFDRATKRGWNLGESFEHKLKGGADIFCEISDFFATLSDEVTRNLLTIVIEGTGRVDCEVPIVTGMFKSWAYMFPNILGFDEGFEYYLDVVTTGQTKVVEMEVEMGKFAKFAGVSIVLTIRFDGLVPFIKLRGFGVFDVEYIDEHDFIPSGDEGIFDRVVDRRVVVVVEVTTIEIRTSSDTVEGVPFFVGSGTHWIMRDQVVLTN